MYYFMYLGPISHKLGLVGQQKNDNNSHCITQSSYSLNIPINLDMHFDATLACIEGFGLPLWWLHVENFRFIWPEKQNHVEVALLS